MSYQKKESMKDYMNKRFKRAKIQFETGRGIDANCDAIACPDEVVALVRLTKNDCVYLKNYFSKKDRKKGQLQKNCYATILLILESPHKDEFDCSEAHPALGSTGQMIEKYFLGNLFKAANVVDNCEDGIYKQLSQEIVLQEYRLIVANLVPYQCSLGAELTRKTSKKRKEEILKFCLDNFHSEIKDRLKEYTPSIVINCCTESSKDIAQKILDEIYPGITMLKGAHPSSAFFAHGFFFVNEQ